MEVKLYSKRKYGTKRNKQPKTFLYTEWYKRPPTKHDQRKYSADCYNSGGGSNSFLGSFSPDNSGLNVDSCGNVYVGSTNQVVEYDANLNQLSTVTSPNAVYDVAV